jgi:6-pyruvoyltetrahydropterin/6-carboxytetrahydropterin synthase
MQCLPIGGWVLSKKFTFEASHQLSDHDGKCQRLHGHSWVGFVFVQGNQLFEDGPKRGMVVDYADIKAAIAPLVRDYLDHWHLNETLKIECPTSELVAKWIYDQLIPVLPGLIAVRIDETCTSSCFYSPIQTDNGQPYDHPAS